MTETFDPQTVAAILAEETHLTKSLITVDTIARGVGKRFKVRLVVLRGPAVELLSSRRAISRCTWPEYSPTPVSLSLATTSAAEIQPVSAMPASQPLCG